jgi:hypothetical protein
MSDISSKRRPTDLGTVAGFRLELLVGITGMPEGSNRSGAMECCCHDFVDLFEAGLKCRLEKRGSRRLTIGSLVYPGYCRQRHRQRKSGCHAN